MNEIWKDIGRHPNSEVSNLGNVRYKTLSQMRNDIGWPYKPNPV